MPIKLTAFNYWSAQATEEMIKAINSPVLELAALHELHAALNALRARKAIIAAVTPSRSGPRATTRSLSTSPGVTSNIPSGCSHDEPLRISHKSSCLADFLHWVALVAEGIALNKDGSFQRTARFRGPDLDSATPAELVAVTARLNSTL